MNIFKNVKKSILAALMVAVLIPTLVFTTMGSKAKADEVNPIQLYSCDSYSCRYSYVSTNIDIKVANWDCNKKVAVHYLSAEDNKWHDAEAKYLTTLNDGYEIWEVEIGTFAGGIKEFALNTTQNGQTYWDNNNSQNYTKTSAGIAPVKALRAIEPGYYYSTNNVIFKARVKNYGFAKKVTVRYTTDNWATYQDIDLSYSSQQPYKDDTEVWSASTKIPTDKFIGLQYAVKYEVNGQTYWDNNFSRNYDSNYEVAHY